jgi:hypothetical protein
LTLFIIEDSGHTAGARRILPFTRKQRKRAVKSLTPETFFFADDGFVSIPPCSIAVLRWPTL